MKAKEYADKLLNEKVETEEEISHRVYLIAKEFMQEVFDLCKARNSTSDSCLISVIKEQIDKWAAFARIVNKRASFEVIKEDGFRSFVILHMPNMEDFI